MKFLKIIFIFFLLAVVLSCSEDTIDSLGNGTITGTVVKEGSNEPIENVKISTSPASSTVFTDEDGNFILGNVSEGEYSVQARKDGFLTQFEGATVRTNNEVNVIFELLTETANNRQPSTPKLLLPEDGASDQDLSIEFNWSSSDPEQDELTYELEIKNDRNNEILNFSGIQDTTYTVDDLNYGYKYFWQVKVSDSINERVFSEVYSFTTADAPVNNNYLFVRNINGNNVIFSSNNEGDEVQLTSSSNNSFRPRKNLNVNLIAFYRTTGGATHLFTMQPDGTNQKQITNSIPANGINNETLDFSWADNGGYLLYPNFDKVYKINIDGSGKEIAYQAPPGRYVLDIQQSEDGTRILVLETNLQGYDGSIFTIDNSGEKIDVFVQNVKGTLGGIDISVDNNLILFTRDISEFESPGNRQLNSKMFIYKVDTNQTIAISTEKPNGTNDTDPRFVPNEASVVFVNSSNEASAVKSIYQVSYDEEFETIEEVRKLLKENAKMPDWE
ncbi:carboxypeptidase regulatory-like domain-containing protein [Gillisia sp. Hel_I_86]|uniref:carboxypeptidase regulatory-like domain-containing protein n=1 Tax=Gillisia sp. Hel_I_86 TaxID=1249981 RepID=UPI0011A5282A|nr:carboxypeptidase regulatory-like domain-containing protein [Gillisia sp. Hel_I_86]